MNEHSGSSRTALAAALMRAVHTRLDRPPLLDDAWADRLVSAAEKTALYQRIVAAAPREARPRLAALGSEQAAIDRVLRGHPTYGGVVIRSRVAEDALADAVARGVRQCVLIGAGFDSFIVRQPPFARAIEIFEIDHPATQAAKRQRLAACGVSLAANVHFVGADLSQESLAAALARSRFAADVPAFFSWLGVTIYLTREANLATLRGVATAAAPGSELVFTYTDQRVLDAAPAALESMRAARAAEGEPWLSGFDPTRLAEELRQLGLELIEDLGNAELRARYCADRDDGLAPGRFGHIARVRPIG
ncbi:MAG: SAM-dependent methyltransferase [bacterium]